MLNVNHAAYTRTTCIHMKLIKWYLIDAIVHNESKLAKALQQWRCNKVINERKTKHILMIFFYN